jgi:4-hydroxy-3-polyprenylbenzoate decarboxylase
MPEYKTAVICAVTGASGGPIALRLISELLRLEAQTHVIFSANGERVFAAETGIAPGGLSGALGGNPLLHMHGDGDIFSPLASGSAPWRAMAVCPCSMGTAGRIAGGISDSLLTRTADVALKERRPLALVPREAPMSALHLENLAKLSRLGAAVIPPMLTFYNKPVTVDEHIGFIVGRVLRALGLESGLIKPWDGE